MHRWQFVFQGWLRLLPAWTIIWRSRVGASLFIPNWHGLDFSHLPFPPNSHQALMCRRNAFLRMMMSPFPSLQKRIAWCKMHNTNLIISLETSSFRLACSVVHQFGLGCAQRLLRMQYSAVQLVSHLRSQLWVSGDCVYISVDNEDIP